MIRALEAETRVPLRVSIPFTPTLLSVVVHSLALHVFSVIWMLPSAVVETPLPALPSRSLPKVIVFEKSCSPPVIADW